MSQPAASLDDLRDIVEAAPVPWWPPAPGWWILAAVVMITAIAFGIRCWRQWTASAYRRAALKELESAATVPAVADILKRTALAAWPRADVAPLSGSDWCDWLRQTGTAELSADVADALGGGVYAGAEAASRPLIEFADGWIRTHRVPAASSRPSSGPGGSGSTVAEAG